MKPWLIIGTLAVVVILALATLTFQLLDSPTRIDYYRPGDDDRTLIVGTTSGPNAWVRVSSVSESATSVTITVRTFYLQLGPSTALGYPYESMVKLDAPLGGRAVIDGTNELPVHTQHCYPSSVDASPCP
jgi:hypothetical protein